jgi:CheY-like chemotaxis protein
LDLSKIEAGRMDLHLQDLSPSTVVRDSHELVEASLQQKRLNVVLELRATGPVHADAGRLRQVLLNVLSNAIKFSPEGSTITIRTADIDGWVSFSFADEGPGIDDALRPRLFEPFEQGEHPLVKRHQGTGLGLAICKHLVEGQGGAIEVESTPGHGATFTIMLPAGSEIERRPSLMGETFRSPSAAAPPGAERGAESRSTVLVVDDHPDNREIARALLEKRGLTVVVAEDGDEGVRLARSVRPALILMDLAMPRKDGYAAALEIKADAATAGIPIVALTALAMRGDKERALSAGIDDYITKPIERTALDSVLDRFLKRGA